MSSSSLHARTSADLTLFLLLYIVVLFADLSDVKITLTLLTWFVHDMLDFAVDISRLQNVRKQKSLVHPLSPCYLACLRYTFH